MTTQAKPPQYDNKPVILIHIRVEGYAWCDDEEYEAEYSKNYVDVPRVICPACAKAHK